MANAAEIADFLARLRVVMPPPRDVDAVGYFDALQQFPADVLSALGQRLVRAEIEGINYAFYPNPAHMAQLCRQLQAQRNVESTAVRMARLAVESAEQRLAYDRVVASRQAGWRERHERTMSEFNASQQAVEAEERLRERLEVRARYGMTPEALAALPDRERAR
jgi:hypothetical protein